MALILAQTYFTFMKTLVINRQNKFQVHVIMLEHLYPLSINF